VRRRWGIWTSLMWFVASFIAIVPAAVLVVVIVKLIARVSGAPALEEAVNDVIGGFLILGIGAGCAAVGVALLAARLSRRPVAAYLGLIRPSHLIGVAIIAAVTLAIPTLMYGVVAPAYYMEFDRPADLVLTMPTVVLFWISNVVVTPVSEEVLYRGLLYRGFEESRLGPIGAIILTTLLFALVNTAILWVNHTHDVEWFDLYYVVALGLGYACLRARSGSIIPPLLVHALINAFPKEPLTGEWLPPGI
jgi:CAAX protease family protein